MSVYRFQLNGPETAADPDGVELPNDIAARAYAIGVARELTFKRDQYLGHGWSAWTMSVSDDGGSEILSFPLAPFAGG